MTLIATRPVKSGAVIVKEYGRDVGHNREAITALLDETAEVGLVLKTDGDGTWSPVVAADVATISGVELRILIDDYIYDTISGVTTPTDTATVGLDAITGVQIGDANLSFGDTLSAGQVDSVIAELEAQGFVVSEQVTI